MAPHFKPTQDKLDTLLECFKSGGDYRKLGLCMGMKPRTIDENVQRFLLDGRATVGRRGGSHVKFDAEMLRACLDELDKDCEVSPSSGVQVFGNAPPH